MLFGSLTLVNPPGPEDMKKISAAIRTLDDLGLIIIRPSSAAGLVIRA